MTRRFGIALVICCCAVWSLSTPVGSQDKFPSLKGPYLGQNPPGEVPELFAPGIISTEAGELNAVFNEAGDVFLFSRMLDGKVKAFAMRMEEGVWREPAMLNFSRQHPEADQVDMYFSPDEKSLYFISNLSVASFETGSVNIWRSDWNDGLDLNHQLLAAPVNSDGQEIYPVPVVSGNLYFSSSRGTDGQPRDFFRGHADDGHINRVERLGEPFNTGEDEGDVYMAPDESYAIITSSRLDDSQGRADLFITFRTADGGWTDAVNLGPNINSDQHDYTPIVSPDGKFFFLTRSGDHPGDLYWVDAGFIEDMRTKLLR
ncbi:MAG: hypothetical protein QNJ14_17510 [Woeseiaceae bacterium]|nr:hypothetical protein [Woeseiaceae bacterium]